MTSHFCVKHNTPFFKKGNMKGYAHPIKDENGETIGWCNEPEGQAKEKEKASTYSPEKSASIERQVAAKIAFDTKNENEPIKETLMKAEIIFNWIHNEDLPPAVESTTDAVNPTTDKVIYATQKQKDELIRYEEKYPGKTQHFMDAHKYTRKLTKAQADILINEFILLDEVGKRQ